MAVYKKKHAVRSWMMLVCPSAGVSHRVVHKRVQGRMRSLQAAREERGTGLPWTVYASSQKDYEMGDLMCTSASVMMCIAALSNKLSLSGEPCWMWCACIQSSMSL